MEKSQKLIIGGMSIRYTRVQAGHIPAGGTGAMVNKAFAPPKCSHWEVLPPGHVLQLRAWYKLVLC